MKTRVGMKINKNKSSLILFLLTFFLLSCEDLFTRFKYETYECDKNPVKLKKIFIKNYEVGEIVEVEFENEGFELKILENSDSFMNLKRFNPKIEIEINKKSNFVSVNVKNHISNFKCSNYVFKM